MNERLEKKLNKCARDILENSGGSHDWDHTERVVSLCKHIGKFEKADLKILVASAILHDIGRAKEKKSNWKLDHALISAKMSEPILTKLGFVQEEIDQITYCIRSHRFKGKKIPKTVEAKVLFDSDKLDAIGAIGIGRAFVFSGELGARVHHPEITMENSLEYSKDDTAYRHFLEKLSKVKDRLFTAEGKNIARGRHEYMEGFFKRLNDEVLGLV